MQYLKLLWKSWFNNNIVERILRNSTWLLSGQAIVSLLGFIQVIVITRTLGTTQYGIFALIVAYTTIIYQLLDSRLWETIIKYVPFFQEAHDDSRAIATIKLCYGIDFVMALAATIVLLATAQVASVLFIKDANQTQILMFYALWPLLAAPDETASAIVRLADRFDWLSYRNIIVAVVKLVGILFVGFTGGGIAMVMVVLLISSAIGSMIILFMAHRSMIILDLDFWKRTPVSLLRQYYRELIQFIFWNNLTATSQMLTNRIDIMVLGLFSTPATVGIYELAKRIVSQFNIIANPIYSAIYPEISKLVAKKDFDALRRVQFQVGRNMLFLVIPICIVTTLVSPWIIPLVFGNDFSATAILVQIMIWQIIWLTLVWFQSFMLATGYVKQNTAIIWGASILYIVALVILIPTLGIIGAAISILIQRFTWMVLALFTSRKILMSKGQLLYDRA